MLVNKLERKFGKYAIPNLPMYMLITYIMGYIIEYTSPVIFNLISFDPYAILHGQIWRLVTWIITVPSSDNIIFLAIMMFFYYQVGVQLERTWGIFKFNLYIFSGLFFTVIGGFILYLVLWGVYSATGDFTVMEVFNNTYYVFSENVMEMVGTNISYSVSTYYIFMSLFLAFAASYPEERVYLYFLLPIKVKWLGVLYGVMLVGDALGQNWGTRVIILMSVLNFIIFFFSTRKMKGISPAEMKRKGDFRKKVQRAQATTTYSNGARHKCSVCGQTELDNPNLEFRYCSKCTGGKEYCQEHLFNHVHH